MSGIVPGKMAMFILEAVNFFFSKVTRFASHQIYKQLLDTDIWLTT